MVGGRTEGRGKVAIRREIGDFCSVSVVDGQRRSTEYNGTIVLLGGREWVGEAEGKARVAGCELGVGR